MSQINPFQQGFALVKAVSQVLTEKLGEGITDFLSDWGKFEAEQKEKLRQLTEEVIARAKQEINNQTDSSFRQGESWATTEDLQETLDQLRSEIAYLRAELKKHRA